MAFAINIAVLAALGAGFLYLVWRYDARIMAWLELKLVQRALNEPKRSYLRDICKIHRREEEELKKVL